MIPKEFKALSSGDFVSCNPTEEIEEEKSPSYVCNAKKANY